MTPELEYEIGWVSVGNISDYWVRELLAECAILGACQKSPSPTKSDKPL